MLQHCVVSVACVAVILGSALLFAAAEPRRAIPAPLADHPGNLFLAGEEVAVKVPAKDGEAWEALDYEGRTAAEGKAAGGRAALGKLAVGWYEVRWGAGAEAGRAAAGVLAPLKAPTPPSSPISIDVAMAWFYPEEKMPAVANLCTLAGINWVRDRLNWIDMEPGRGQFAGPNKYDASARIQSAAGLRVLQVNHISPRWANPNNKRFPLDMRDAYRFFREVARRWAGQVAAFEPWNEADIDVFGGHTGAEMASMQKASYLGLKAGNPGVIACQNVFAMAQTAALRDLAANEAWPYFDTFNLHHYCGTDQYPGVYAAFRAVSAGRPMWVTEFAVPVPWKGDEKKKEPSEADLRVQAERIAQVFAASLHENPQAAFYFLLPHYVEGQTQFGILRPDLTPRPAFVALAAVGRLLADARPLGRLKDAPPNVRAFLFSARPDGREREVLVAWAAGGPADLALPAAAETVFDHLGRPVAESRAALKLSPAPAFAVLPAGTGTKMALAAPAAAPPRLPGEPSPLVLQAVWPQERVALAKSAYRLSGGKPESVPVYVYNFSDKNAEGTLSTAGPQGWKCGITARVKVPAGERAEAALTVDCSAAASPGAETVRVTGDFGPAGKPVLSLQIVPEIDILKGAESKGVPGADRADRWRPEASGGTDLKVEGDGKAIVVTARLGPGDRWVYPRLELGDDERLPADLGALQATFTLLEGEATFRAVFREENGAAYVADFVPQPQAGKSVEALAVLTDATHGAGWSSPDPNGRLDADRVRSVTVGCNPKSDTVKFRMENLKWLRRK